MKEIAPDLWHLRGLRNAINVYLAGDVLIDAATRLGRRRILSQVGDRPLSVLALTHVHPDHQGSAKAICETRGIPLACHADDVEAMEGRMPSAQASAMNPLIRRSQELIAGPPHEVGRVLREGDEVGGFRAVHAPGHTPGEVIYFRDSDRVAICGDVIININFLTTAQKVGEPPTAVTLDRDENRRSIRKLIELGPSLICPGHGPPLRDIGSLERLAVTF